MAASANESNMWWEQKNPASTITSVLQTMRDNSLKRLRDYRIGAVLYGGTDMWGPYIANTALNGPLPFADDNRLRLNITQSATDTLQSRIGENTPRPYIVTSGGDYQQQRQAEKLTALLDGVYAECDAYAKGGDAFRDACVLGDGFLHATMRHGRIRYERVPAWEVYVDDVATVSDEPRQMHRARLIERSVVAAMFPDKRKDVETATSSQVVFPAGTTTILSDMVELHESWRLPSGPDEKDGLYVASVGNTLLQKKEWKRVWFPFARFQWSKRMSGFWGQGLAEQLKPIQLDINREAALLQKAHYRQSTFDWWLPTSSKVVSDKISNEVGNIIKFSGSQVPYSSTPSIAQPERYRWLQWLVEKGYEISGVSQMSATSAIPAGMESGKAIRAYTNVGTARFKWAGKEYERFYCDLATITIGVLSDYVNETGKKYPVNAPSWSGFDQVDFKEIDLTMEQYAIQVFPTASLPNEPAGRMQEIADMQANGIITAKTANRLYGFPDIRAANALVNAAENYAADLFDQMRNGKRVRPDPYDDLSMLHTQALQHYNLWRQQDVSEMVLDLCRDFINEVVQMQVAATPAPPPAMPAMPPMPPEAMMGAMPPPQVPVMPPQNPGVIQ